MFSYYTSTHDLHTEVDEDGVRAGIEDITSTHDLHTEVDALRYKNIFYRNTSTHDLHTEVDRSLQRRSVTSLTSTHDLHTEVDFGAPSSRSPQSILQLTTSTRRSTRCRGTYFSSGLVLQLTTSTRRSTTTYIMHEKGFMYFNSRPPHGGRLHFCNCCA